MDMDSLMDYKDPKVQQAGEVVQSFMAISRTLTKFTTQNAESLGLNLPQMGILNLISAFPGITLKDTGERLHLPKSTVSVNVESLVQLELINRQTMDDDRREIHLSSTLKGQELSGKSSQNALSYRAMLAALEKIPEQDIQVLIQTQKALLTHLQECKFCL